MPISLQKSRTWRGIDGLAIPLLAVRPERGVGFYALVLMDATLTQRTPWAVVEVGRRTSRGGVGSERWQRA